MSLADFWWYEHLLSLPDVPDEIVNHFGGRFTVYEEGSMPAPVSARLFLRYLRTCSLGDWSELLQVLGLLRLLSGRAAQFRSGGAAAALLPPDELLVQVGWQLLQLPSSASDLWHLSSCRDTSSSSTSKLAGSARSVDTRCARCAPAGPQVLVQAIGSVVLSSCQQGLSPQAAAAAVPVQLKQLLADAQLEPLKDAPQLSSRCGPATGLPAASSTRGAAVGSCAGWARMLPCQPGRLAPSATTRACR